MLFNKYGGMYQLAIDDAAGLALIDQLNPALWAVTSAPLKDLQCDPGFLVFMDPESRGRVRIDQVVAARDWLFKLLAKRERLTEKSEVLRLADLDTSMEEGRAILKTAERILNQTGAADKNVLSLTQVRAFRASYAQALANGDGIIPPEVLNDAEVVVFVNDIIAVVGGTPDASGRTGVGTVQLDRFLNQGKAYLGWKGTGTLAAGTPDTAVQPWGEATAAAAALVKEFDGKLSQYFWQCDLVRQESAAAARLHLAAEELAKLQVTDAAAIQKQLADAPLAEVRADGTLSLDQAINPYYQARFNALRAQVLTRALGNGTSVLTRASWQQVLEVFAPYWGWLAQRPSEPFEKLDAGKLGAYCDGPLPERLRESIKIDQAAAPELAQLVNLEKLVLLQRWLLEFANNFVNLSALFEPGKRALFEMGTLVIDGRRLEFTVKVTDRAEHKKIAVESRIFIVYAVITDQAGKTPVYEVAAAVTRGERGRLVVGKRGVFFSGDGKVYDAQIVDVIENPISIIESIYAPFRRVAAVIEKKVTEFASGTAQAAEGSAVSGLSKTGAALTAPRPAPAPAPAPGSAAPPAKKDPSSTVAMLAGGGVVLAALGSAMAYVVSALSNMRFLGAVKAMFWIVAAIVACAALIGWLKLRRRDMGVLLEANGWAVNLRIKLTRRLSRIFNRMPGLPRDAVKRNADLFDGATKPEPEADDAARLHRVLLLCSIVLILLAAWAAAAIWTHEQTLPLELGKTPARPTAAKVALPPSGLPGK